MIDLIVNNETDEMIEESVFQDASIKFENVLGDRIGEMLDGQDGEVSLVLTNDDGIHKLNRDYRKKDCATDVLSFAYLEGEDDVTSLVGDIFISIDTAKRQASEKGHSLDHELKILFVHGLLHLFGFDHNNDKEENEMEKYAAKILG